MSTPASKKHYATQDFKDAGTEKAFGIGDDLTAEAGLSNYIAAGLASDKKPEPMLVAVAKDAAPAA